MMQEIAKLIPGSERRMGYLAPEDYERTVDILMSGDSDPVITERPEGAYTHDIYEMAYSMN
jgi:NitT/TauT family transport system substrate-binding protein